MKHFLFAVVVIQLSVFVLTPLAAAPIQQTSHTLKLEANVVRPKATLADVSLLIGHWKGDFLGSQAEELWLPAAGGSMVGVFRLFEDSKVIFYELMILVEEQGSVSLKLKHFHNDLSGWEEKDEMVTFQFVQSNDHGVWFEGLTFLKNEDGSLQGYIAIRQKNDNVEEIDFLYKRVVD